MNQENRNLIAPYQYKGRWYQAFIENDAGTYKITTIDDPIKTAALAETTFTLPENFVAVDVKCECAAVEGTAGSMAISHSGTKTEISLPTGINYLTLYIFGYFA